MEQRCFTSLVFSANGGMGHECKKFYSVLAEIITIKRKQEYCLTMSWLQRKISFSLTRSVCYVYVVAVIVNQEKINVANDIEISESLSNSKTTEETAKNIYYTYLYVTMVC